MKLHFILKRIRQWQHRASKQLSRLYIKGLNHLPITIGCLILLLFIPVVLITYTTYRKYQDLKVLENRLVMLEKKAKKTLVSRVREGDFMKQAQLAQGEFVQNHLMVDKLLQNEQLEINHLLDLPIFKESSFLLQRQSKLSNNKTVFKEKTLSEKNNLLEKSYTLKTPIEVDTKDLEALLGTVEGNGLFKIRPQLFFQHFIIKRKEITSDYSVFELDYNLLERSLKK